MNLNTFDIRLDESLLEQLKKDLIKSVLSKKFNNAKSDVNSLNSEIDESKIPEVLININETLSLIQKASKNEIITEVYLKNPFIQFEE